MAIVWQFGQTRPTGPAPRCGRAPDNRDGLYRVTSYFWIMDAKNPRAATRPAAGHASGLEMAQDPECQESRGTELVDSMPRSAPRRTPRPPPSTEVRGGLFTQWQLFDRTNHVSRGGEPDGANVLYVDGHMDKRPFDRDDCPPHGTGALVLADGHRHQPLVRVMTQAFRGREDKIPGREVGSVRSTERQGDRVGWTPACVAAEHRAWQQAG